MCLIGSCGYAKETRMQIDKNIPPPVERKFKGKGGYPSKYPFREMKAGDSVFFPGAHKANAHHPAYMVAKGIQKRDGIRFTLRSVMQDGQPGIRIWRLT